MSGTGEDGVRFAAPLDLADPRLERLIVRLAVPSVAGLSITALHHVANAAFVGLLSGQALAAVSLAVPIFALVAAIGHGLGIGGAASIGRLLGAGDALDAGRAASATLALCVLLGGAAGIDCSGAPAACWRSSVRGRTSRPSQQPISGCWPSRALLLLAQIACDFIAIAEGNSRFSMWTLLGAFALNIVLDPLLIFGSASASKVRHSPPFCPSWPLSRPTVSISAAAGAGCASASAGWVSRRGCCARSSRWACRPG